MQGGIYIIEYRWAVERQQNMDNDAIWRARSIDLNPDAVYPNPTGRDNMLHVYTVALTPEYKDKDKDIVVKVKAFDNTRTPSPEMYIPPREPTMAM